MSTAPEAFPTQAAVDAFAARVLYIADARITPAQCADAAAALRAVMAEHTRDLEHKTERIDTMWAELATLRKELVSGAADTRAEIDSLLRTVHTVHLDAAALRLNLSTRAKMLANVEFAALRATFIASLPPPPPPPRAAKRLPPSTMAALTPPPPRFSRPMSKVARRFDSQRLGKLLATLYATCDAAKVDMRATGFGVSGTLVTVCCEARDEADAYDVVDATWTTLPESGVPPSVLPVPAERAPLLEVIAQAAAVLKALGCPVDNEEHFGIGFTASAAPQCRALAVFDHCVDVGLAVSNGERVGEADSHKRGRRQHA